MDSGLRWKRWITCFRKFGVLFMEIHAIVPARSGSQGLIDKNIYSVCGHPLVAWSIVAGKQSEYIDKVILSTDSERYAEIGKRYGAEVPFLRPRDISDANALDTGYIDHYLKYLTDRQDPIPDLLVILRPTSPNRDPKTLDRAIQQLMNDKNATGLRSAHLVTEIPEKMISINKHGYYKPKFGRDHLIGIPRQRCPQSFMFNCYIDIIMPVHLTGIDILAISVNDLFGTSPLGFETPKIIDINTYEDLKLASDALGQTQLEICE